MIKNRRALFILLVALVASAQEPSGESTKAASELRSEAARTKFDAVDEEDLTPLDRAARIDVLRAGIRLDDLDIARWCARRLRSEWLDHRESRRVVELLLPTCFDADPEIDPPDLYGMMGFIDVPAIFAGIRPDTKWTPPFGKFHVFLHSYDTPLGCKYLASRDERLRRYAREVLSSTMGYSDDHREMIARALLIESGVEPQPTTDPTKSIPRDLAALLETVFLPEIDPMKTPESDLQRDLPSWLLRWLLDVPVGAGDAELLNALTHAVMKREPGAFERQQDRDQGAIEVFLRRLGSLDDVASAEILDESLENGDLFAAAALVQRGRMDAVGILVEDSSRDALALALLIETAPEVAVAVLRRRIAEDRLSLSELLAPLGDDLITECEDRRIRFAPERLAPITADLERGIGRGDIAAAAIGLSLPGCATRTLARRAVDALESSSNFGASAVELQRRTLELLRPQSVLDRFDLRRTLIAFLDIAEPVRFRASLRSFCSSVFADVADAACEVLFELEDAGSDRELVAWMKRLDDSRAAGMEVQEIDIDSWTGALPPALAMFLLTREGAVDDEGSPVTVLLGVQAALPKRIAENLAGAMEGEGRADLAGRVAGLLREGKGADAIALVLEELPLEESQERFQYEDKLPELHDPRVVDYLQRVRARRDLRAYADATGALSLIGEPAARAEIHAAVADGTYGICTEVHIDVLTDGFDPRRMPYWIEEAKSQCCRIAMNGTVLDAIDSHVSWFRPSSGGAMTSYERAKRRWDAYGGKFVYHPLPERFVPAP